MTDDLTRPEVLRLLLKRMSTASTAVVKDENNCLIKAHLRRERKILEEFYRRNGDVHT